ncbi:hypothetical protein A3H66_00960 [Candidatus Falkowbacteria bacterium RIFCSPLOWO2_02_FULL_45_21]|uniref:Cytidyltransferase-like domain-containing protein n=1 Tax=Candidatus Falkowbacteria bacterium RIFCSPLOWO2_02_FULL_45_21 TaxID=1797989 RepID=A0A1F5SBJ3_9BACT|nr:MAG: hypothetical protein A3H66_00960 [Candidatus Falkowbacteria bacterium RIFCSPLOWO2_02_FULL_45_21]
MNRGKALFSAKFKKKKTVMVFGTFDLLHPGHKYLLRQAKKLAPYLIVVIARDRTVSTLKGKLPYHDERQRQQVVTSLNLADQAIFGSLTDKFAAIKKYRPDIICLGYDQINFTDQLEQKLKKLNLKTKIVRLKSFKPDKYKTSILKNGKLKN